ncbi:MAG: hypothetical protein GY859_29935, partial [Desulfobacterales bacterium]|nr:hypothetical protein [Desulfobacterales bacterium]
PKPIHVKILKSGADFFEATWDLDRTPETAEIKEIIIKKRVAGAWRSIWSGPSAPRVRAPSSPVGQFRIVAVDCALNRSWTDFTPDVIVITRRGCGSSRGRAYTNAAQKIEEALYEEHIKPRLQDRTGLTTRSWAPPEIIYTPKSQTRFYKKDGKWCSEVSGQLNRPRFNQWIDDLARKLDNRRKRG